MPSAAIKKEGFFYRDLHSLPRLTRPSSVLLRILRSLGIRHSENNDFAAFDKGAGARCGLRIIHGVKDERGTVKWHRRTLFYDFHRDLYFAPIR